MKKLTYTEEFLKRAMDEGRITEYALAIGYGGEEWLFTSKNVNTDTYFDAASLGKIFPTTTLALRAIGDGRLSLDDTLEKFFPDTPDDKKNITVKQLLTHTSGMLRREFPDNVAERGRESIAEFILNVPLAYEIGTKYAYCCTGIVLLGFIVEKVYGMTLDVAFQKCLCEPLGLTRSRYNVECDEPNAVNCNHDLSVTDIRRDDYNVKRMRGIPAGPGGNYCTVGDLTKFVKAIMDKDERLYSNEMFELAERNYTENLPVLDIKRGAENHGLGFTYVNENCIQARDLFPDGSIGHDGWTGQSFYLHRDSGLYVIFLSDARRCAYRLCGDAQPDTVIALRAELHKTINKDLRIK